MSYVDCFSREKAFVSYSQVRHETMPFTLQWHKTQEIGHLSEKVIAFLPLVETQ